MDVDGPHHGGGAAVLAALHTYSVSLVGLATRPGATDDDADLALDQLSAVLSAVRKVGGDPRAELFGLPVTP